MNGHTLLRLAPASISRSTCFFATPAALLLWTALLWPAAVQAQIDDEAARAPWQLPPSSQVRRATSVGWQSDGQTTLPAVSSPGAVDAPYTTNSGASSRAKASFMSQAVPVDDPRGAAAAATAQGQGAPYVDTIEPQGPDGGMPFDPAQVPCQDSGGGSGGSSDFILGFPFLAPLVPACQDRLWVRGEYLVGWMKGGDTPPLVTTSPAGTAQAAAGVLGQPGTQVLFGDGDLNNGARSGLRVTLNYWFCPCQLYGIEASYFGLAPQETEFFQNSTGTPILARPFFNAQTSAYDAGLIAYPGVQTGLVDARLTTDFQGGDLLLRRAIYAQCGDRLDFLIGYRYAQLIDNLRIDTDSVVTAIGGPVATGTSFAVTDAFDTRNEFHGIELGILHQYHYNQWSLELLAKTAVGDTISQVTINGGTTTSFGGASTTGPGGLLALPTNIGVYHRNDFSMIPELGATAGLDLTARLRLTAGYSLVYWSKVVRAGDQVDYNVNTSQAPTGSTPGTLIGIPSPHFPYAFTDFWAQGLNIGLDYRF